MVSGLVLRGESRSVRSRGSYFNSTRFCRSAQRWGWNPNGRGRYCGFRLLAARAGPFDLSPPIDDFPTQQRPPSIFDAIDANDFDLALRVITADPAAVESVDGIPPPLHDCIYGDRPEWLEWLLDHGADIERREQDYGSTPLTHRGRASAQEDHPDFSSARRRCNTRHGQCAARVGR